MNLLKFHRDRHYSLEFQKRKSDELSGLKEAADYQKATKMSRLPVLGNQPLLVNAWKSRAEIQSWQRTA